ncbi:MAG: acyl-CoA dehydrogenase family protein, partial [Crocinitomicaceae bacterium]
MHFELTEEHLAVKEAARDFAQNVLKPEVIDRDNAQRFPAEEVKQLGELGFMGMMVDPKYGGSGMDTLSYVLAMEEISKVDASTSVCMSVNNSLVCWGLEKFGTEEQKQKYLVPLAKGEKIGAFCLSEPEAGSDATSQRTTAIEHMELSNLAEQNRTGNPNAFLFTQALIDKYKTTKPNNLDVIDTDWLDLLLTNT